MFPNMNPNPQRGMGGVQQPQQSLQPQAPGVGADFGHGSLPGQIGIAGGMQNVPKVQPNVPQQSNGPWRNTFFGGQ